MDYRVESRALRAGVAFPSPQRHCADSTIFVCVQYKMVISSCALARLLLLLVVCCLAARSAASRPSAPQSKSALQGSKVPHSNGALQGSKVCNLYHAKETVSLDEYEYVGKALRTVMQTVPSRQRWGGSGCKGCMSFIAKARGALRVSADHRSVTLWQPNGIHNSSECGKTTQIVRGEPSRVDHARGYALITHPVDRSANCSGGVRDDGVSLIVPVSGYTYGEMFERSIYPAYAALDYLVNNVLGGKNRHPDDRERLRERVRILVLPVDPHPKASAAASSKPKLGRRLFGGLLTNRSPVPQMNVSYTCNACKLCGNPSPFWPVGTLSSLPNSTSQRHNVPSTSDRVQLHLSDGSSPVIDFHQTIQAACSRVGPTSRPDAQRQIADFVRAWGVRDVLVGSDAEDPPAVRGRARCLRRAYVQVASGNMLGFFQEGVRFGGLAHVPRTYTARIAH